MGKIRIACLIPLTVLMGCPNDDGPVCGDNLIEQGEACEPGQASAETCESLGFVRGTLACSAVTCGFDTSACVTCGDGDIDVDRGEDCDGTELGAATCVSIGRVAGTLACNADCSFNQTMCNDCGNNTADNNEECDGTDLGGATCESLMLTGGPLTCTPECHRTGCTGPDLMVYADGLQIGLRARDNATASECEVETGCAGGMTGRRLLDFTLVSENVGNEVLHFGAPNNILPPYTDLWEPTCFRGRREFKDYATYWLCPASEPNCAATGSVRAASGEKGSFCFIENFGRAPDWEGAPVANCGIYDCGDMGQRPGCADNYYVGLDCQFIDVTDVADGEYTLCAHIDPTNRIHELRDDNNIGCTSITIPPP